MSLSAPSSPGNGSSCYEQVPMEGFDITEDNDTDYDRPYRRPWAANFDEAYRCHRKWRFSHQNSSRYYNHHRCHRKRLGETQDLPMLLRQLGLEVSQVPTYLKINKIIEQFNSMQKHICNSAEQKRHEWGSKGHKKRAFIIFGHNFKYSGNKTLLFI